MTSFVRKMARRLYKVKIMTKNEGPYDPAMYFMGPIYSWIIFNWTNIRKSPAICIYIYVYIWVFFFILSHIDMDKVTIVIPSPR